MHGIGVETSAARVEGGYEMANVLRDWRVLVLWAGSLIAVGAATAAAQRAPGVLPAVPGLLLENQTVVSGEDIGFRLDRVRDGVPIGHVVIRVDGRWVDTVAR
jgi:hypothetical protein